MSDHKPRVVLFRHAPIDFDSRAKRIAGTLQANGFEAIVISLESANGPTGDFLLDSGVRVIRIPMAYRPPSQAVKLEQVAPERHEPLSVSTKRRRQAVYRERITGPDAASAKAALRHLALSAQILPYSAFEAGVRANDRLQLARERAREARAEARDPFRDLNLAEDLVFAHQASFTLRDLLVSLRPDILHAHNPYVLPAAWRAADALRRGGHPVRISYDVREDFAGIPDAEIGNPVTHRAMVETERIFMPHADFVSSVSQEIADLMTGRYHLPRPAVGLPNYPVFGPVEGPRTVRDAAGLPDGTPLIVYSGVMTRARGMETLVEAMRHVPSDAHLAIVTMPMPHPYMPELQALAEEFGVADRIHFLPPVDQSELIHYLSGADIAVHPMPGGAPNHERAMPNKLFEYLHAGLTLVCSDARVLSEFAEANNSGRVFTSNDPVDLGRVLTATLADPVPREHLRKLAERYSWQHNEKLLLAEFRRLAAQAAGDPRKGRETLVPEEAPFRPPGSRTDAPHVVMFRHAPIDIDTRAKKIAATLTRGGYRATVISVEPEGSPRRNATMGDVDVLRVPLAEAASTAGRAATPAQRAARRVSRFLPTGLANTLLPVADRPATVVDHLATTLVDLLVELEPDVLHVHHPHAFEAARRAKERIGSEVRVVYDARENWAGLPMAERGYLARHAALVAEEAAGIVSTDAVMTVADPLAAELKERFSLTRLPVVAYHYPPEYPLTGTRTVRDAVGLGPDARLLVYSGVLSRARDLDLLVRGLAQLPVDVHLVFVSVPYPHPQEAELRAVAEAAGVDQARVHFAPPVEQHEIAYYLSGADIAVSAIPKGSANHDLALPNKLFEYLHARLPLVLADAAAMKAFAWKHGTGTVFPSGDVNAYVRAVEQNLETPISGELLAEKAAEHTWQMLEPRILALYDRLTGFVHREPEGPFPAMTVIDAD